ncbi:hypothetical protein sr13117 [Sporisorium reilianum SRZ2]|uniref:Uncharacterized protein n=1 Tax=Sporisorium reilianum (strain SRZ2) TaxID=999809 RepID=E6ZYV3_SPORE|nr:hypothetical protein sr13117 [Sporisorium reilianum SRZ2]
MRPMAPSPSFLRAIAARRAAPVASRVGIAPRVSPRSFTSSAIRKDDQSRAKAEGVKQVLNRPEITPLFLFTDGMVCLALFFGGRHLIKDKELRLDHQQQNRLATQTEQLDFDAMAKVADDPDGKLTKDAIEEDRRRSQRKHEIKQDKQDKAAAKV